VVQFSSGTQDKSKWANHSFFEHGPVGFLVRLKNSGTVHEQAKGDITVTNWLGKKTQTISVNATGGKILPDSIRRFQEDLGSKQLFGHYTATLALTYAGNKPLNAKLGFWVIPWKLLTLLLIGLIILIWLLKVGLKRYNEHIISQARRR